MSRWGPSACNPDRADLKFAAVPAIDLEVAELGRFIEAHRHSVGPIRGVGRYGQAVVVQHPLSRRPMARSKGGATGHGVTLNAAVADILVDVHEHRVVGVHLAQSAPGKCQLDAL